MSEALVNIDNADANFRPGTEDVPAGYKRTEVGVVPKDWNAMRLGDMFVFKNGLNKAASFFGSGTPIINYMDVFEKPGIKLANLKGRVNLKPKEIESFEVRLGDMFFTRTSETVEDIGIASVMLEESYNTVFSGFVLRARPRGSHLDIGYKQYCFGSKAIRSQIISKATYTTRALTNGRTLSAVWIAVPPKSEQRAIAEALSDVDRLLESLDALIAKKRAIKQATMQQLLTGTTHLPGFARKWEDRHLCDFVEVKKGELITSKEKNSGSVPVIAGGKEPAYYHNLANRHGKTITISGSGANAGYVAFFNQPIFASDCSTISESMHYSIEFVYFSLKLRQQEIYRCQTGGAQPHVHSSDLQPLLVGMPSIQEQKAIATILSDMDAEITALEQRRDKIRVIKQGMMQQLLTGRVRLV